MGWQSGYADSYIEKVWFCSTQLNFLLTDATPATFETPERQTPAPSQDGTTDHTHRTHHPSQTEKGGEEGPRSNPEPVKSRFIARSFL